MRLLIHRIIDTLLRLLPGHRTDPASIEARTRRVVAATAPVVSAAIAEEARVFKQAHDDAIRAAADAWTVSSQAGSRAKQLDSLAERLR